MAGQFRAAGIPVPPEFSYRKSYSLAPKTYGKDYPEGAQSIGILCLSCYIIPPACLTYCLEKGRSCHSLRWKDGQIYVTKVMCSETDRDNYRVNQKGGATISVLKRGGWIASFKLACKLAGWTPSVSCNHLIGVGVGRMPELIS